MTTHHTTSNLPKFPPTIPSFHFHCVRKPPVHRKHTGKLNIFLKKENLFRYILGVSCRKTLFLYAPGENYSLRSSVTYRRFSAHYLLPTSADFGEFLYYTHRGFAHFLATLHQGIPRQILSHQAFNFPLEADSARLSLQDSNASGNDSRVIYGKTRVSCGIAVFLPACMHR